MARLFLEFGADVSSYLTGFAPVEIAARGGKSSTVQVLVEFGADVNETGRGGAPAVVSAAVGGHLECLTLLIRQLGADVNCTDLHGQSALHAAVKLTDPVPTIHLLLRSGIDSKLTDRQGLSAMQVALAIMNIPALEALGGRHLETQHTGAQNMCGVSVSSNSFLESSVAGGPSNASAANTQREKTKQPTGRGAATGQARSKSGTASK